VPRVGDVIYNLTSLLVAVLHSSTAGVGVVASAAQAKWVISGFWEIAIELILFLQGDSRVPLHNTIFFYTI
jgi:hypothetical protein